MQKKNQSEKQARKGGTGLGFPHPQHEASLHYLQEPCLELKTCPPAERATSPVSRGVEHVFEHLNQVAAKTSARPSRTQPHCQGRKLRDAFHEALGPRRPTPHHVPLAATSRILHLHGPRKHMEVANQGALAHRLPPFSLAQHTRLRIYHQFQNYFITAPYFVDNKFWALQRKDYITENVLEFLGTP